MAILSGTGAQTESARSPVGLIDTAPTPPAGGPLLRAALRMVLVLLLGIAVLRWISDIIQIFREANGGFDFISYYAAALALGDNPAANIYALHTLQLAALAHHAPYPGTAYIYPPLLAIMLMPLTTLPAGAALNIWLVLNFALWLACLGLTAWLVREMLAATRLPLAAARDGDTRLFLLAVVAFLAFTYDPLAEGIALGQIQVLISFLVLLGLFFERRGRPGLAGTVLAVACLLKVYPLVLLGYYLLRGRWRVLRGAGLAFVLLVVGMLPFLGIQGLLTTRGLFAAGNGEVVLAHNEALLRAPLWLAALIGAQPGAVASVLGVVLVGLVGVAFVAGTLYPAGRGAAASDVRRYGWLARLGIPTAPFTEQGANVDVFGYLWALCTMVLVAPVSWEHSYTWLLPVLILGFVYVLLVGDGRQRRTALLLAAVILSFALTTADFPLGFDQKAQFAYGPLVFGHPLRAIFMLLRPLGALLLWGVCGWLYLTSSRETEPGNRLERSEVRRWWPARTPHRFVRVLAGLLGAVIIVRVAIITVMLLYGAMYDPTALMK